MSDVCTGVFAKRRGCTRGCCCAVGFDVCLLWLVRTAGCSGIHFHRVLSGKEVLLGQRMLYEMIGTRAVEYSSEHAQLQSSKDSSQIECSTWFLHQRAISNCRQYCFGLLGLISAVLYLYIYIYKYIYIYIYIYIYN